MLYVHQVSAGRAIEDCVRLYASIIRVRSGIGCVLQPHTLCCFFLKLVEGKRKGIGRRLLHILSLLWVLRGKAPMICAYEALSLVPMLSALFGVRLQCVIGKQDNRVWGLTYNFSCEKNWQ